MLRCPVPGPLVTPVATSVVAAPLRVAVCGTVFTVAPVTASPILTALERAAIAVLRTASGPIIASAVVTSPRDVPPAATSRILLVPALRSSRLVSAL